MGRHAGPRRRRRAAAGRPLRLMSRNENDVSVSFPELLDLARRSDLLLDGEVVALATTACPTFGALADRMHVRNARRAAALAVTNPVTLLVFDVLRVDGRDVTGRPLVRAARAPRGARPERRPLAGARGVRRRRDALRGHPAAGPRGHRQQASGLPLRARTAQPALAEVPAPAPARRTSWAAGGPRPARPAGSARCWWGSRPRRGWSTVAGSVAGSPARRARALRALLDPLARAD